MVWIIFVVLPQVSQNRNKMATNFTDDENYSMFERLVCSTSLHELHAMQFLTALNIFLSIATSLGNTLILVALRKESSLQPPSKLLYICLATTDLCVGLLLQPLHIIVLITVITGQEGLCIRILTAIYVIGVILLGLSLSTLTAISVDRLLALLLRLRYRRIVTLKRTRVMVAMAWVLQAFVGTMFFWVHFAFLWYGYVYMTVCIVTSTFSYTKIYFTLRQHRAEIQNQIQQSQPYGGGGAQPNEALYRKTVSTVVWIQLTLMACYVPYGIYAALITRYGLSPSFVLSGKFVSTLVYVNSALNPFLYCWKMRGVRQAVKDMIRQIWCSRSNERIS